jgi:hypothetical protein
MHLSDNARIIWNNFERLRGGAAAQGLSEFAQKHESTTAMLNADEQASAGDVGGAQKGTIRVEGDPILNSRFAHTTRNADGTCFFKDNDITCDILEWPEASSWIPGGSQAGERFQVSGWVGSEFEFPPPCQGE